MSRLGYQLRGGLLLGLLLGVLWTRPAHAAEVTLTLDSSSPSVGQQINVAVRLQAMDQAMNLAEGVVTWTTDVLRLESVSTAGSILEYWPIPPSTSSPTQVAFSGGLPNPGFNGPNGLLLTLSFTAQTAGAAEVRLDHLILHPNDGVGENILVDATTQHLTVTPTNATTTVPSPKVLAPPILISASHPDQQSWYQTSTATIGWITDDRILGVSYLLNGDALTIPDDQSDLTASSITVPLVAEGIWYFHCRLRLADGWTSAAHYTLRDDHSPPLDFQPTVRQERAGDPTTTVVFSTTDLISHIARYEYRLDAGPGQETTSPLILTDLTAGDHQLAITAIDQAGQTRQVKVTFTTTGYPPPLITEVNTALLVLDPIALQGTAVAGDHLVISLNGRVAGEVDVPNPDHQPTNLHLRLPWNWTGDRYLRPGTYTLTATATSVNGQISVPTAPVAIRVRGSVMAFNGHAMATFAVITPLAVLILSLFAVILGIMVRLTWAVWMMHQHERLAERDLAQLEQAVTRQPLTSQQLTAALTHIADELTPPRRMRRPSRPPSTNRPV